MGAASARYRDTPLDVAGRLLGIVLYAAPIFWLGILFQLLFSVHLHWLPTGGRIGRLLPNRVHLTGLYTVDAILTGNLHGLWEALRHLALPAMTLGLVIGGVLVRLVRVTCCRRCGPTTSTPPGPGGCRSAASCSAMRCAAPSVPVVAVVGLQFALLLSGAVLTEATFSWPGSACRSTTSSGTATTRPCRAW